MMHRRDELEVDRNRVLQVRRSQRRVCRHTRRRRIHMLVCIKNNLIYRMAIHIRRHRARFQRTIIAALAVVVLPDLQRWRLHQFQPPLALVVVVPRYIMQQWVRRMLLLLLLLLLLLQIKLLQRPMLRVVLLLVRLLRRPEWMSMCQ
jgi:hypothetical protein